MCARPTQPSPLQVPLLLRTSLFPLFSLTPPTAPSLTTLPSPGCTEDPVPQLFVVDPCFKEQFQLPNATPEYTALWQELPSLFVGTAEQLVPIVELMCTQVRSNLRCLTHSAAAVAVDGSYRHTCTTQR
jgi:hypothetical protein